METERERNVCLLCVVWGWRAKCIRKLIYPGLQNRAYVESFAIPIFIITISIHPGWNFPCRGLLQGCAAQQPCISQKIRTDCGAIWRNLFAFQNKTKRKGKKKKKKEKTRTNKRHGAERDARVAPRVAPLSPNVTTSDPLPLDVTLTWTHYYKGFGIKETTCCFPQKSAVFASFSASIFLYVHGLYIDPKDEKKTIFFFQKRIQKIPGFSDVLDSLIFFFDFEKYFRFIFRFFCILTH